jgi:hypothetical protein
MFIFNRKLKPRESREMNSPPEKTKADTTYAFAKALVGFVPVAGHALAILMEQFLAPPIEKRRDEWARQLASVITELQRRDSLMTIESLRDNESFISAVLQASQTAIRTHRVEKIEFLKQAVLSAAGPRAPSDDKQQMFFRIVDELTPIHVRVLTQLRIRTNDQVSYADNAYKNIPELSVGEGYTAVIADQTFIAAIVKDLQFRALLHLENDSTRAGNSNSVHTGATYFGEEFLTFIGIPMHDYSK